MSDFSSVTIKKNFALLPDANIDRVFTTNDLPDNPEDPSCSIDGMICEDGLFARRWNNQSTWNPQLNGWVELKEQLGDARYFFRFKNGIAIEVLNGLDDEGWPYEKETDAFLSPSNWILLETEARS